MESASFHFDRFSLHPGDRRLLRDGEAVPLNARCFDALVLLVREGGALVTKDQFMQQVWRGVPVTDEVLTQCIKTLRRQLGDDARQPRFIETVPKHGYRFIAPVRPEGHAPERAAASPARPPAPPTSRWREFLLVAGAGTIGAGLAGVIGGLFYGFVGASFLAGSRIGSVSVLLVLLWLTIAAALIGGLGVSAGISAANLSRPAISARVIAGGAAGGLVVGGAAKLLGLDAFNLLFGRSVGDITGAAEGALLGGAIGLGLWIAGRRDQLRRGILGAALTGGAAGAFILAAGGRLMGGSLDLVARNFPESRLRVDPSGTIFGEDGLGRGLYLATGAFEGGLFAACIVGAILIARRGLAGSTGRAPRPD